jgi:hypothetical protein
MCKELCDSDGSLLVRCDDCAVYLCYDAGTYDSGIVEKPGITGAVQLCAPCFDERQEEAEESGGEV